MSFNQKNYINEYKKQNYSTFKVDLKKEEKEELFLQRNYNGTVRRNRTS